MTDLDAAGRFTGMSKDEKAVAVLSQLSMDKEVTLSDLIRETGLTQAQIHQGIRHLREAKGADCIITHKAGPSSTYKLAEDAPEVRDYANRRMNQWLSEVSVMHEQMVVARRLLPRSHERAVELAAETIKTLLRTLQLVQEEQKERAKLELKLSRRNRVKV